MSTTREMPGVIDFTGTAVNTLHVGRAVRLRPAPVHETECTVCHSRSTATYASIRDKSARCKSSGCGKTLQSASRASDPRNRVAELEAERIAAERVASEARMESETATHKVAPPRVVIGNDGPETERQRMERRAWAEQVEAERRAADAPRLEAERKQQERIAELQREQQNTLRQLHAIERERVANGKDDQFTVDPATTVGTGVPLSQLDAWNETQAKQFVAETPGYYPCKENVSAIVEYIERNAPGLKLLSAAQFAAAYKRLSAYGLLKERPAPAPEPAPAPKRVNLTVSEAPKPATPKTYTGRDPLTGRDKEFTEREVDRMGSEEYRRTFPVETNINAIVARMVWPNE